MKCHHEIKDNNHKLIFMFTFLKVVSESVNLSSQLCSTVPCKLYPVKNDKKNVWLMFPKFKFYIQMGSRSSTWTQTLGSTWTQTLGFTWTQILGSTWTQILGSTWTLPIIYMLNNGIIKKDATKPYLNPVWSPPLQPFYFS